MEEKRRFAKVVSELRVPVCPQCGSKEVAIGQQHSACMGRCNWIGASAPILKNNILAKAMIVQEDYMNLSSGTPGSLKSMAQEIARTKDFPGAGIEPKEKYIGAARCFIPKLDEFGEKQDIETFMGSRTKKSFRLGVFNFMERAAALIAATMYSSNTQILRKLASARYSTDINQAADDSYLIAEDGSPNPHLFRKKSVIEVDNTLSDDKVSLIKIYSCCYGRPDAHLWGAYTKSGGIIPKRYPQMKVCRKAYIWQPFYWPAIDVESDDLIRLAGVIQGGDENYTYIVTQDMDTGGFSAGVYCRKIYEHGVEFIKSKAETVEDAIKRLRTSFEKVVMKSESSGQFLDFSWIMDWGEETPSDESFFRIISAPFWDESIAAEMLHLIGLSKTQLLQEMYKEIRKQK